MRCLWVIKMATKKIEEVVELKRDRTVYICDSCGKESCVSLHKCFVCGDDICGDCGIFMIDRLRIWSGDADWCCKRCWKHGEGRVRYMDAEEDKFMNMVRSRISAWRREVIDDRGE